MDQEEFTGASGLLHCEMVGHWCSSYIRDMKETLGAIRSTKDTIHPRCFPKKTNLDQVGWQ